MGLFDGLESLGFSTSQLASDDLFKPDEAADKKADSQTQGRQSSKDDPMDYLYAKELECPVCNKSFINFITRKSRLRLKDMELDMKANYHAVNANCYDVFLCPHCGYASLIPYFNRITDKQKEIILNKIKPSYKSRDYPMPMSLEDAAERYKLALFCAMTVGVKAGQKAIICLKTAWVYRDMKDKANEILFLKTACTGLQEAYRSESFPIGAMDETTVMFMIGELFRRTGDFPSASKWISGVVVAKNIKKHLKERASTSKDLIRSGVDI